VFFCFGSCSISSLSVFLFSLLLVLSASSSSFSFLFLVFFFFLFLLSISLSIPVVPPLFSSSPLSVPSRGCLYLGFYRAGRSIGAVTAGSNGVGHSIQRRNVPAFDGGAIAEEENKRTVARPKRSVFQFQKLLSVWSLEFL
jgi:hypothetical protein